MHKGGRSLVSRFVFYSLPESFSSIVGTCGKYQNLSHSILRSSSSELYVVSPAQAMMLLLLSLYILCLNKIPRIFTA
jgi:hypothetical protein